MKFHSKRSFSDLLHTEDTGKTHEASCCKNQELKIKVKMLVLAEFVSLLCRSSPCTELNKVHS